MQNRAITVRLPEDISEHLRREAFEQHVSQASIVIEALRARFGLEPPKVAVPLSTLLRSSGSVATDPRFMKYIQNAVEESVERWSQKNPGGTGPGQLLTVEEAARELQIARRRVFEMIAAGTLPSLKIGKSRRITRAALEEYIRRMEQ